MDLFVAKGNVEAMPDYAAKDPSNLLLGQPDGTFVEGAEEAGIVDFGRAAGRRWPTSTSTACSTSSRSTGARTSGCGGTSGPATATPAPMGNWLGVRLDQEGPNRDAIGAWIEVRIGDRIDRRAR